MFRTAPGEVRVLIEDWIYRPALRELVEAFGGTWPEGDLEHVVAELAEWSKIWDYRSGKSRLIFHDNPAKDDPHAELTYRAAEELGLLNPTPPSKNEYDYMLILGGLATGVEPRVKYAAQLVEDGLKIRIQIAGLGSYRPLHQKELPISHKYAPDGRYEIDHLVAMMAAFFADQRESPDLRTEEPGTTATTWEMNGPDLEASVAAYAAASSQPNKRSANTADTYELFVKSTAPEDRSKALLITSAIYAPYQHLDAAKIFGPKGVTVETVGAADPRRRAGHGHLPHAYRQEMRSVLLSSRRQDPPNRKCST